MFTSTHQFALCLYEDLVNTTVWVGSSVPRGDNRAVDCPFCVSCSAIDETICAAITKPQNCVEREYGYTGDVSRLCPHEIDCNGASGKFVRVRLPGQNRAISLDYVKAYRTRPKNAPTRTAAEDPKRGLACYAIEAYEPAEPRSSDFLDQLKVLDYQISFDPTDPIFYSTCFTYGAIPEWLPIESEGTSAASTEFVWNFSGHCLDCDAFAANYLAFQKRSFDPKVDSSPQWWFNDECVGCNRLFGLETTSPPTPIRLPPPTQAPTRESDKKTLSPSQAVRTHTYAWELGRSLDPTTARIGDSVVFQTTSAHTVYLMQDFEAYAGCDFSTATELVSTEPSDDSGSMDVVFTTPLYDAAPTYLFACGTSDHCSTQAQKVTVVVSDWFRSSPAPSPLPTMAPQPGVIVAPVASAINNSSGDTVLQVSEDGTTTSTFTFALATGPLSPVRVTFSSTNNSVVCEPSVLNFDHTNFVDAVTVGVLGVDESVDQGSSLYTDEVVVSVQSYDSLWWCKRNGFGASTSSSSCGQAAEYNGFSVAPIKVVVENDDTAGMLLTDIKSNASFNSYGDALSTASFAASLTSRPLRSVTVKATAGLGAYCDASPASITFSPTNWDLPMAVSVACLAPTSSRPACSGGALTRPLFVGRNNDQVVHSLSGSTCDPVYSNGEVFARVKCFNVTVSAVSDLVNPPTLSSARFSNTLNSI